MEPGNELVYGYTIDELLFVLDFSTMCAVFLKTLNKRNDLNIIVDRPYNCAIVETDDHIVFGVKRPDKPTNKFALLKGFRVRGEGVSDDSIRNTLMEVAKFSPDAFIWVRKSALQDNKSYLKKIASMLDIKKKQSELGKPEYADLSQELKRSGQEYYDMILISKKTITPSSQLLGN